MAHSVDDIARARARRTARGEVPGARHCTDSGNSERLIDQHGTDLRFVAGLGWHVWDGRRWAPDTTGEVHRRAKQTVRSIYQEAARCEDEDRRKELASHARKSESREKRAACVALAQHELEVVARSEDLDADPMTLNVANGTIDLATGTLRPHRREDLCTKIADVPYDPDASAPTWDAFLERVQPDPEVRSYLARLAGYTLTGSTREESLAFCFGTGANGKSVFLLALRSALGDYAVKAPRGLLMSERPGAEKHSTEIMTLRGARLAWCSEVNERDAWDEAKTKDLASADPITARLMRQDNVTFDPTHKLWINGNHRPRVRGDDEGIWRRLKLVPWPVTIPEGERDKTLAAKLEAERSGILGWAVRGCLGWLEVGLSAPSAVRQATDRYRADEDQIGRFLADRCQVGPREEAFATELYKSFVLWSEAEGEGRPPSQQRFGRTLTARGFKSAREQNRNRRAIWMGVSVLRRDVEPSGGDFPYQSPRENEVAVHSELTIQNPPQGSAGVAAYVERRAREEAAKWPQ